MTRLVASLGMYDHPAQHDANDTLWAAIAAILRDRGLQGVPEALDRTRDVHAIWRDPNLLLAQACGYPLLTDPTFALRTLALPHYDAPGCDMGGDDGAATHRSLLIARIDDPRSALADFHGARAAVNDRQSNTGMNLFRAALAPIANGTVFSQVVETGSHRASIVAVGSDEADLAAIDCVTYAAIARFEPDHIACLKIVARSPASPTLPFVTAARTPAVTVAALCAALDRVVADPELADARRALFLSGIQPVAASSLAPIAALEAGAIGSGYAELR